MSKPTYEELALKIKAQETTIESLKQLLSLQLKGQ
jgi:hypothetical protein